MSSSTSAKIFEFPGVSAPRRSPAPHQTLMDEQEPGVMMDAGMLAMDAYPFEIDEPDPLLIVEGRNLDFLEAPGAARMTLIDNPKMDQPVRRLRLKDLHPMDIAIIMGFLIVVAVI